MKNDSEFIVDNISLECCLKYYNYLKRFVNLYGSFFLTNAKELNIH
jgi:hypothetical protein